MIVKDGSGSNFEEKTCETCIHMNTIPFCGPCEDCEIGHLDGWEPINRISEAFADIKKEDK